jgi:hypothetical protein
MIDKSYASVRYIGDGETLQYFYDFDVAKRFDDGQIVVFIKNLATLAVTTLIQDIGYSLDFENSKITLAQAYSDNYEIIIARFLPFLQDYDFINLGLSKKEQIEAALDYRAMIEQQLKECISDLFLGFDGLGVNVVEEKQEAKEAADAAESNAQASAANAQSAANSAQILKDFLIPEDLGNYQGYLSDLPIARRSYIGLAIANYDHPVDYPTYYISKNQQWKLEVFPIDNPDPQTDPQKLFCKQIMTTFIDAESRENLIMEIFYRYLSRDAQYSPTWSKWEKLVDERDMYNYGDEIMEGALYLIDEINEDIDDLKSKKADKFKIAIALTLDKLPLGFNLRGKTLTFDLGFDVGGFLNSIHNAGGSYAGIIFNNTSGMGRLSLSISNYTASAYLSFGSWSSTPPLEYLANSIDGWNGTSFTFPDDQDYIVTSNGFDNPALPALSAAITADGGLKEINLKDVSDQAHAEAMDVKALIEEPQASDVITETGENGTIEYYSGNYIKVNTFKAAISNGRNQDGGKLESIKVTNYNAKLFNVSASLGQEHNIFIDKDANVSNILKSKTFYGKDFPDAAGLFKNLPENKWYNISVNWNAKYSFAQLFADTFASAGAAIVSNFTIAEGNSIMVAAGNYGQGVALTSYSTDGGVTWTEWSTNWGYGGVTFLTFKDGSFYLFGKTGYSGTPKLLTSADGQNWTEVSINLVVVNPLYDASQYYFYTAVNADYGIYKNTSSDLINWTTTLVHTLSKSPGSFSFDFIKSDDKYILSFAVLLLVSSDGINFTEYDYGGLSVSNFRNIRYANGIYMALQYASTNSFFRSVDLINWEIVFENSDLQYLTAAGNKFYCASVTKLFESKDGIEWTEVDTSQLPKEFKNSFVFDNKLFIEDNNGNFCYSSIVTEQVFVKKIGECKATAEGLSVVSLKPYTLATNENAYFKYQVYTKEQIDEKNDKIETKIAALDAKTAVNPKLRYNSAQSDALEISYDGGVTWTAVETV